MTPLTSKKLDGYESRILLETAINLIEAMKEEIKGEMTRLDEGFAAIKGEITRLREGLAAIKGEITRLGEEFATIKGEITWLGEGFAAIKGEMTGQSNLLDKLVLAAMQKHDEAIQINLEKADEMTRRFDVLQSEKRLEASAPTQSPAPVLLRTAPRRQGFPNLPRSRLRSTSGQQT